MDAFCSVHWPLPNAIKFVTINTFDKKHTMFSHEILETVAEQAEEYLDELGIELVSHSYENIIRQAQQHGFELSF